MLKSVVGFGVLSGCARLSGPPRVLLSKIKVFNLHSAPHTLHIEILETDVVAFETTLRFPGRTSSNNAEVTALLDDELPENPGVYSLRVTKDSTETEQADLTEEFSDGGEAVVFVDVSRNNRLAFAFQR